MTNQISWQSRLHAGGAQRIDQKACNTLSNSAERPQLPAHNQERGFDDPVPEGLEVG
jgi:hypothetical protein